MPIRTSNKFQRGTPSFNMTPVIDIVFQLIIFFAVACQFIEAENFPVAVPEECGFAESDLEHRGQVTTVTVIRTTEEKTDFAVGAEKVTAANYADITEKLAELIDARLKDLPAEGRVVILRIDKDVPFDQAQYALAGVAASCATDIRLAVLKDKGANLQ
ncbi:MAG: biopolymer transporter ExbD [Sedimentisphaerales bacterium]|nr:biopolymer transporter ExbD [Sedimentisphaerales bacterium]